MYGAMYFWSKRIKGNRKNEATRLPLIEASINNEPLLPIGNIW